MRPPLHRSPRLVSRACLLALAATAALPALVRAQGTATLRGTVTSGIDHEPLGEARVSIDVPPRVAITNGGGRYTLRDVPAGRYDVVFMDVQMPVMDGTEATRRILDAHSGGDRPRIIALTAGVMADEVQACRDAGVDDFLAKPIDPARLAASLAQCRRRDDGA